MADYYQRKAEQLNGRPVPEKAQAAKRGRWRVAKLCADRPRNFFICRAGVSGFYQLAMGSPWMKRGGKGVTCERLYGRPVPPPRPIVKRLKKIR